jgi:hypothetical protein
MQRLLLLLVLVASVAAGWWWWSRSDEGASVVTDATEPTPDLVERPVHPEAARPKSDATAPTGTGTGESPPRIPAFIAPVATAESARVFGVWSQKGVPVSGRRVRAIGLGGSLAQSQAVALTDSGGAYELHLPAGSWKVRLGQHVAQVVLVAKEQRRLDCAVGQGSLVAVTVTGPGIQRHNALVVIRTEGEGLMTELLDRTDAMGGVVFSGVPEGPCDLYAELYREASGPPVVVRQLLQVSGPRTEVVLHPPEGRLRRSFSSGETPLAGAALSLWYPGQDTPLQGFVDHEGRTDHDLLPEGSIRVLVNHPLFAPTALSATIDARGRAEAVEIHPGRRVAFRATDNHDRPMHTRIHAVLDLEGIPCRWECRTDEDGRTEIRNLPTGDQRLTFSAPFCQDMTIHVPAGQDPGTPIPLRFVRLR